MMYEGVAQPKPAALALLLLPILSSYFGAVVSVNF